MTDVRRFVAHEIGQLLDEEQNPIAALAHAVARGRVETAQIQRPRDPWPSKRADDAKLPFVVAIWDRNEPVGPGGWRNAKRLRSWCEIAAVLTEEPSVSNTEWLLSLIETHRRIALVEISSRHADAWSMWFGDKAASPP